MSAVTEKLYDIDSELFRFEATVLSCEACERGGYAVVLDRTAFFPESVYPNGISIAFVTDLMFYVSLVTFVLTAVLALKKVHPILIICLSAVIGIVCGYALDLQM